ncbi:MAG: bifunctional oligoribonuclease/PAP phosphatase NrnA [Acholeplasmataceae bacterium]|nr:bifunctional oligoribonuclease/PAP phosphatase NrnA [Acholeplasmataceae bacterium]
MKRILEKIKAYNTIIIHGHKRPDGDCYGSQFGLKDIITTSFPNKAVYVVGEQSDYVDFVGQVDVITDDVYQGALSIVVDTAVQDRVSDKRYVLGKEVIKIDHHIPVDDYGHMRWVDTNFPSCAQMIAYFYHTFRNELKMTKQGAVALYTGIVTDTGRFRYRGVSRLTHQMAGMLLSLGAAVEEIDRHLSKETLNMVALKGYVYSNFVTTKGGFVYLKMTREAIIKYEVTDEQAASVVNLLSGIEGFPVWALFIEYPTEIRVRLRSNGPDIDKLANHYEGGGHAKAAGAKLKSWDDIKRFVTDVEAVVKRYLDTP